MKRQVKHEYNETSQKIQAGKKLELWIAEKFKKDTMIPDETSNLKGQKIQPGKNGIVHYRKVQEPSLEKTFDCYRIQCDTRAANFKNGA